MLKMLVILLGVISRQACYNYCILIQKPKSKSDPDVEIFTAVSVFNYSRLFGSHGITYC